MNAFTSVAIYKIHFLSFIEYGSVFLDYLPQNLKNKLQRCQNKCLRVSQEADRYTSNLDLHLKCKILPLRYRRKISLCAMMYKNIEQIPEIVREQLTHHSRLQRSLNLESPFPRKETFKETITYQGPVNWNNLPLHIKMSNNYAIFKRKLKKYLTEWFYQDGIV